ncbi:uncharacterized protein CANTADRAFT_25216 [Suhomyces tanzawaensis NRRL Y-17324]|uniref:Uncharacterized protein n=1 Tax=Suhomyces tanzawaensis NRRL Y-17324 TaxID=984487 RepID=A0A1E4SMU3_9ASCO|nr:uncharacterized protein CANTADRAFT_25216 [Suhomyces tanzawaensis NRRL Y-17324]ODV80840.1 hypothetical protein CANTADRAFT_25216 [Suhomyces tanzawaensis NRRL Y-17324]
MDFEDYTATRGMMYLLLAQNNNPALGTGTHILATQSQNLLGGIPDTLLDFNNQYQINLFGNYPVESDKVPSAIFAAAFAVLMVLHIAIFAINASRGHYFWLTLGWIFYCIMRVIGWIVRIYWIPVLYDTTRGISNEVFLILPSIFLTSFNLILAQRIFTWRHPVGGSRRLFWNLMITLYVFVAAIVAITVLASAVPYVNFLSDKNYTRWKKVVEASSILIILYSLTSISLIGLAYFFKPTAKDENLYTYQPWWVESFSPFYFVKPGAKEEAEETFMKRNHNHRHAIRVIAATHHHYNMVEGTTNQRGDLTHNYSLVIIAITTVLLLVGAVLRSIVVFEGNYHYKSGKLCQPVAMYICWGLFEFIINALYIVGRVDLRFYRPDKLPKKVRSIITAEQSVLVSDNEEEEEEYEYETDENYSQQYKESFNDSNDLDFSPPNYHYQTTQPAHPKPKTEKNEEEFHF